VIPIHPTLVQHTLPCTRRRLSRLLVVAACLSPLIMPTAARCQPAPPPVDWDKDYVLTPTSLERGPGVERGTIQQLVHRSTGVFPGTIRRVWIYSPARKQLEAAGEKGAAVMVFQDGHTYVDEKGGFHGPIVLDNLIHAGKMPPTVGIFVDPGHKGESLAADNPGWKPTPSNRSVEYDTLSPDYARFIEEEILPLAARAEAVTAAGVQLTSDPERRGICGISSGGICAFTAAWERPDLFRKVVSHVGSFTDIRGGDKYPSIVRRSKASPKPIRVILQDGEHDLDNQFGSWWLANLQMEKALAFAGYDHTFLGGVGGHNHKHGAAVLPQMLEWVWRDWKNTAGDSR
jgi:enterochelin esterase-like enzyme